MTAIFARISGRLRSPGAVKFGPTAAPKASSHIETAIVVGICAAIIYVMTKPAFNGFFFGEDFNTTSLYIGNDRNFLKAIFSPVMIFFRPTAFAWVIITQGILPWDPVIHHWRNFIVLVLCAWLLYRIMIRLTDSVSARLIGIAFFTVSKVHLTLIGLIDCIEVLGTVVYALLTFLFLVRYFQNSRLLDYVAAVVCFALCAFARDTNVLFFGVVILGFAANAWQIRETTPAVWRRMAIQLLPFFGVVLTYAVTRYVIVGLPKISGNDPYSLYFDAMHILSRLHYFIGTAVNVSFDASYITGVGDLSTALGFPAELQQAYRIGLAGIAVIAFFATLVRALRRDLGCLVPLAWACALLLPTLLIGNRQIYYAFEPITALSLFLAVALDQDGKNRLLQFAVWVPLLVLTALNGYISNRDPDIYWWRLVSNREKRLDDQIYKKHRGEPIKGLTIVVDDRAAAAFYQYLVSPFLGNIGLHQQVPLLNVFLSPTVASYLPISFEDFSLEAVENAPDQLVYRLNKQNETYTNLTGRTIEIASIEADSSLDPAHDANKLDGAGSWMSVAKPGPHTVTVNLAVDAMLSSIRIRTHADRRIGELEVRLLSDRKWKSVFNQQHLQNAEVINARWPDTTVSAVQLVIKSSFQNGVPTGGAAIEEIEFPENRRIGMLPRAP